MKAVIQRVSRASVTIDNKKTAEIGTGLLVLLGITHDDGKEDIKWLSNKIVNCRIFSDNNGVMNNSVKEENGDIIVVSQFTLHASTKKGHRPSYIYAAKSEVAGPIYESFLNQLEMDFSKSVQTGIFGADMQVELINDGPVTIIYDSKNKV
ncbi:MAG: D-aminoacyl-tRNA deacylase [Bacteroidota bacterium]